jgi:hypothetical protein
MWADPDRVARLMVQDQLGDEQLAELRIAHDGHRCMMSSGAKLGR